LLAFGADPTGTNDSLSAFSAATKAAATAHKGIYAPSGNYQLSGPYVMTQDVPIHGDGRKTILSGLASDYVIKAIDIDAPQIAHLTLQSKGGGLLLKESHRALVEDVFVPRGVAGIAFNNIGSIAVRFVNCTQTTNGYQISPNGAIPTYGYLGQDGPTYPINSTILYHFVTEGATMCGICSSTAQFGQGYFTISGGIAEGTSAGYNLNISGSQSVTIHGLHMEAGHGAGPAGMRNKDWIINKSAQISIYGEQIGNGYINNSSLTRLDSVLVPQLDIDAASTDTHITGCELEWNNGYFMDLGINTVVEGSTYPYNSYARVGNKAGLGRNVLNPNGDLERWTGSPLHPDGFYAYGGATIVPISIHRSGSYGVRITAVGTAQYQGLGFDLGGPWATNPTVNQDFVSVGYWLYTSSTLTKNPGVFADMQGYSKVSNLQEAAASIPISTWVHFCRSVNVVSNTTIVITPAISPTGGETIIVDDIEISRGRACSAGMDYAANQATQYYLSGRRITSASGAPTNGDWRAGDMVLNSSPTAGNAWGWIAIVSGTPGTWMALLPPALWSSVNLTHSQSPYSIPGYDTLTMAGTNSLFTCNASAGAVTINLPSAGQSSTTGVEWEFIKTDSTANPCTIQVGGRDFLNGSVGGSYSLIAPYKTAHIRQGGPNYFWVVANN